MLICSVSKSIFWALLGVSISIRVNILDSALFIVNSTIMIRNHCSTFAYYFQCDNHKYDLKLNLKESRPTKDPLST